ncbi:MAG: AraC family transcriptional regulator [Bacteroidota bacterium]
MSPILEKVSPGQQQSIRAFEYAAEEFAAPWHFHPEYELTYIKQSSGIRYVGNHMADFAAGDLVLLGSNLPHCWKNLHTSSASAKSLVIQWPVKLIGQQPEFDEINQLLRQANRGITFTDSPLAAEVLLGMERLLDASPLEAFLELVRTLSLLTREAAPRFLADQFYTYDGSDLTSTRLQHVQAYVNEHYHRKLSLAEVAGHVHLSEQAFSRFFSRAMGRPFFQFLNEYRINRAARLLLESKDSIANIGYACGYDSLPFFFRKFKELKGMTPGRFRVRKRP